MTKSYHHILGKAKQVIPAKAGIHISKVRRLWIPAFAGMTLESDSVCTSRPPLGCQSAGGAFAEGLGERRGASKLAEFGAEGFVVHVLIRIGV
jgi:hypothetical protein